MKKINSEYKRRKHELVSKNDATEYKRKQFDFGWQKDSVCLCDGFKKCGLEKATKRKQCFSFCKLDPKEIIEILAKLTEYKSKTWQDIEERDNTSTGKINIERLEPQVKKMIQDFFANCPKYETDELYKIEIGGSHRVWGVRQGCLFYPIWDDPNHNFYKPINKSYTSPKKISK